MRRLRECGPVGRSASLEQKGQWVMNTASLDTWAQSACGTEVEAVPSFSPGTGIPTVPVFQSVGLSFGSHAP